MAWLDATPEKQEHSRRDAGMVQAPAEDHYEWILEPAVECGLCRSSGMGMIPLDWSEIDAWARAVGEGSRWVRATIRRLSVAYVEGYYEAKSPVCPDPMGDAMPIEQRRATVKDQLSNFISKKSR